MKTAGNIFVFWTILGNRKNVSRDDVAANKWIGKELQQGRLRQGWGPVGSELTDDGHPYSQPVWLRRFIEAGNRQWPGEVWFEDRALSRYKILSRMLQIRSGDRLVIPSIPGDGSFTIATVSSPYSFDLTTGYESFPWDKLDFGHLVGVLASSIVVVDKNASPESAYVASRFSCYRSAVNVVRIPKYREAVLRLADG